MSTSANRVAQRRNAGGGPLKVDGKEVHKGELTIRKVQNCSYLKYEYNSKDISNSDAVIEIDGKTYNIYLSN